MRRFACVVLASLALVACSPPAPPPHTPPAASGPPAQAERVEPRPDREDDSNSPTTGWDVDLRRDEQRGGHTIARHVGRTDAQLKARLSRESIAAASTYADLATAERIVELALAENARQVRQWIDRRGPRSNLAIRYRARGALPTGRIMRRGDDESRDAFGAVVVLRWRDDGLFVLTSYPENSR